MSVAAPPETATPGGVADAYVRNMGALWQWDARLAMALEAIPEGRLPALEGTRDGAFTVRGGGGGGGGGVYLHSRYRPLEEAARWAAGVQADDKYVVIVHGFGLGYHVAALYERLADDAVLVVGEPDLALLKRALEATDFSEMLASGRVMFFTDTDRGAMVERLEGRSPLLMGGTVFAAHGPSMQAAGDFHAAFGKLVTEFVAFTRTGYMTLMLNNVATCRNIANNLGRYVTTPPLDDLHQAHTGVPAILVAAGPSLARNMHLLQEVKSGKRRAVIIAVQTMLKPLLAAGIEPDYVTSLDYNTVSTRFFENLEEAGATGKVHLVAEPKAHWNVLDVFDGRMTLTANEFADKLLRDAPFGPRMGLKAGATVAHLSFYLAEFLGCDPIILIGQDLGFVDGLYYKPGTAIHETWGVELGRFNTLETKEWERIARSKAILRKIPDIHGHPMYTEEQFFVYLQQFERDFAATRCRVIDATEGGAMKQHVTRMTLREALDGFCAGSSKFEVRSSKERGWDRIGRLREAVAALGRRRDSAAALMEVCEKTVPLLEEMIEKQGDAGRMAALFVEVDRLRSRVGDDPDTFEMVTHLNTIGELRRFQHDLGVKREAKDSLERQRRQLLRDVDYVKNLRVGCERLLEILDEAIRRMKRQAESIEAGQRWPLEVAGGRS